MTETRQMHQQIYNTQSQSQHIHAHLPSANTDRSYSFVKEEKRKYP